VLKFWRKKIKGFWVTVQDKWKGYEKLAFFDQYIAVFRKQYKIRP